jgi:hypothetical protein
MDQLSPLTVRALGVLALQFSKSVDTVMDMVEFERQQLKEDMDRRITKRKRDKYDFAVLASAIPLFSSKVRRFWVDVRSNEWNELLLNGIMLQDEQFEKTFRMSRDSFAILHGLLGSQTYWN